VRQDGIEQHIETYDNCDWLVFDYGGTHYVIELGGAE